jgi:hypothetical protein
MQTWNILNMNLYTLKFRVSKVKNLRIRFVVKVSFNSIFCFAVKACFKNKKKLLKSIHLLAFRFLVSVCNGFAGYNAQDF